MKLIYATAIAAGFLISCGEAEKRAEKPVEKVQQTPLSPTEAEIEYADTAEPADQPLADLYNRSCISCHSVDGAGAPLTGHTQEWKRRLAIRGMEGLLASTVNGRETMPAMGMCMDCTNEQLEALIAYMVEAE